MPLYPPGSNPPPPERQHSNSSGPTSQSATSSSRSNHSVSAFHYRHPDTPPYAQSNPLIDRPPSPHIRPYSTYPPGPSLPHSEPKRRTSSRQDYGSSSHHESRHTSSTKKSKHGTNLHHRLLSEILDQYPHIATGTTSRREYDRAQDDDYGGTFIPQENIDDPPHPRSGSAPSQHYSSRRTHSRSHTSSDSISALLLVTTERLNHETSRANAAEKNANEVMSLFKNTHEQKVKLERELMRVREELGVYKIQLDVAQKGMFVTFLLPITNWLLLLPLQLHKFI